MRLGYALRSAPRKGCVSPVVGGVCGWPSLALPSAELPLYPIRSSQVFRICCTESGPAIPNVCLYRAAWSWSHSCLLYPGAPAMRVDPWSPEIRIILRASAGNLLGDLACTSESGTFLAVVASDDNRRCDVGHRNREVVNRLSARRQQRAGVLFRASRSGARRLEATGSMKWFLH